MCRVSADAVPRLIGFLFSLIDSSANVHLSKFVSKSTNWNVLAEDIVNQKQDLSLSKDNLSSQFSPLTHSNDEWKRERDKDERVSCVATLPERPSLAE